MVKFQLAHFLFLKVRLDKREGSIILTLLTHGQRPKENQSKEILGMSCSRLIVILSSISVVVGQLYSVAANVLALNPEFF
jgi:hypothetical protein